MKSCPPNALKIKTGVIVCFILGLSLFEGLSYADAENVYSVSSSVSSSTAVTAQSANEQPVLNTGNDNSVANSDNADKGNVDNKGAMTLTQPVLGAPQNDADQASEKKAGSTDTSKATSEWESLDDNTGNTEASASSSQSDADAENRGSAENLDDVDSTSKAQSSVAALSQTVSAEVASASDEGDEHVVWHKRPIEVVIPTGKERMVSFPVGISTISADASLTSDELSLVYNEGTLYLKALKPFEPVLVIVHFKDSSERVLIRLSSQNSTDDTPLDVVISGSPSSGSDSSTDKTTPSLNYVDLMRFAIEQLYSPQRLISESADIARTPMYTQKTVTLLYGNNTQNFPEVSWRGGDDFVTAVVIKNTQSHALTLDPRNLHGTWLAAGFYPTDMLAPRGRRGDETTLFVISEVPFEQARLSASIGGQ